MHIKIKKMSRGFITVFTKARHFSLPCAKKSQSTPFSCCSYVTTFHDRVVSNVTKITLIFKKTGLLDFIVVMTVCF